MDDHHYELSYWFGEFARDFASGRFEVFSGRCRDLLPLLVITPTDVAHFSFSIDRALALQLLNVTCADLNYLFSGGERCCIPQHAFARHRVVLKRLISKLECALAEIRRANRAGSIKGSFHRLVSSTSSERFPAVHVDDVDVLANAASLDPLPFLPKEHDYILSRPELFPPGVSNLLKRRVSHESHYGDQVTLTIRMLWSGKLSLMRKAEACAETFVVGRWDGTKLRDIWNGSHITNAALPSPKPPLQATPTALTTLETSDDRPQTVTFRDGKRFFDQLRVPNPLRPFLGRPCVLVKDLRSPPPCESGAIPAIGLNDADLGSMIIEGALEESDSVPIPVSNTFPMGFGWSSYVAQFMLAGGIPGKANTFS